MKRSTKALIVATVAGIFAALIILFLAGRGPDRPVALQFLGRIEMTNQTTSAVFVLTNPGPTRFRYFADQEWGPTYIALTNGMLPGGSAILLRVSLSEKPTRLVVNYYSWARRPLRDMVDDIRDLVGLPHSPRSAETVVFSDELTK